MWLLPTVVLLLTPPPMPRPVASHQLRGESLCLTNPDGTVTLLDLPGSDWRWETFSGKGLWFASRGSGATGETVWVHHEGHTLTKTEFLRSLKREPKVNRWPKGVESRLLSWDPSDYPTQGSVRYVTTIGSKGQVTGTVVGYLTPHGLRFEDQLRDQEGSPAFRAVLGSFRLAAAPCGS
jgi:hypothetical protein